MASSERPFLISAKYVEDELSKLFFRLESKSINLGGHVTAIRMQEVKTRVLDIESKLTDIVRNHQRECTIQHFRDALSSIKAGIETLGLGNKPSKQSAQHLKNALSSVRDGRSEADERDMLQEPGSDPYDCSPVQGVV